MRVLESRDGIQPGGAVGAVGRHQAQDAVRDSSAGAKDQGGWREQERSWGQGGAEGGPSGEGWGLGQQASAAYKGPGGARRGLEVRGGASVVEAGPRLDFDQRVGRGVSQLPECPASGCLVDRGPWEPEGREP